VIGAKVLAGALAHEKFGPAGGVPQTAPQSAGEGSGTPAKSGAAPSGPTAKQIKDQADAAKELETLQASLLDKTTHRLEAERKIAEIEAKQGHALDAQLKARLLGAASKEDAAPGLRSASAAARKAEEARKKAEEQAKASDDLVFQAQEGLLTATRAALQAQLGATKDGDERAAAAGADARPRRRARQGPARAQECRHRGQDSARADRPAGRNHRRGHQHRSL
jgi:hypothetical protein